MSSWHGCARALDGPEKESLGYRSKPEIRLSHYLLRNANDCAGDPCRRCAIGFGRSLGLLLLFFTSPSRTSARPSGKSRLVARSISEVRPRHSLPFAGSCQRHPAVWN